MSDTTIEWTDKSWNPIRARLRSNPARIGWHCEHASPGCEGCYAETMNRTGRTTFAGTKLPYKPGHLKDVEIFVDAKTLQHPTSWRKPSMIFVCSMTDLFGRFVEDEQIDLVFAIMALNPRHTFQVLTKRASRMRRYLSDPATAGRVHDAVSAMRDRGEADVFIWPLPNVWCGVSVEDQIRAQERIPDLLLTPAALHWLSCEPLLGQINLVDIDTMAFRGCDRINALAGTGMDFLGHPVHNLPRIGWIVAGGESGHKARPLHPDIVISLRDQCEANRTPFLFKQWGGVSSR